MWKLISVFILSASPFKLALSQTVSCNGDIATYTWINGYSVPIDCSSIGLTCTLRGCNRVPDYPNFVCPTLESVPPRSESTGNALRASPRESEELIVRLYVRGSSLDEPAEVCAGNCEEITLKKLSPQKPTKLLIHGWQGHEKCVFYKELVKAFLENGDYNILTVDWSLLGANDFVYPNAQEKVPAVAGLVAKFLIKLRDQLGVKLENLHIIGHSLGAHLAGVIAYELDSGKIGRITGLDPAGPLYSEENYRERLSKDSANFVDVIHTSPNFLGYGNPLGHIDFYPNGPHMIQPGCGFDLIGKCSHRRSFYMYAESLVKPDAFPAVPCLDWVHFQRKECGLTKVVPMGESTPPSARGVYYLATNSKAPFGKGTIG